MDAALSNSDLRSILIVDDEDAFLMAMKQAISEGGRYRISLADSGKAALEALRHQHFDVILLDYKMPGMSGIHVLQRMHEEKMDTPVVMLTAAGSESVAVEAMKLGAYDYVRKEQIDTDHLCILVDGVVERYLFRKEKERRELIERQHELNLVAIETFHSTLAALAQIVNNSLSIVALKIREHERKLRPLVTEDGQRRLANVFPEMMQEHSTIALTVKAMLDMANVLHGNFTEANYTERMQGLMESNVKNIQERRTPKLIPRESEDR